MKNMTNKNNNEETFTLAMIFKNWWQLIEDFGLKVIFYMSVMFYMLGVWKFIELVLFAVKHIHISVSII